MAFNLFWIHSGESFTVTSVIVIPQYLGACSFLSTSTSKRNVLSSTWKSLTEGVINSKLISCCIRPARKSLATPKWLIASDLFGVRPISKISSISILKTSAAEAPTFTSSFKTIIPSWLEPRPNSSSAQIIPWLSSPLIFPFFILKLSPLSSYRIVPIVATGTFWPTATFGAPQTICKGCPDPKSTVVIFNLSAFGCCIQVNTLPTTMPFKLPLIDSLVSIPSTSKPKSVSNSPVFIAFQSIFKNCLSQLYDIFIISFVGFQGQI